MNTENPVTEAIELVGLAELATALKITYQAIKKWEKNGMPRTEWTSETNYSETIQTLTKRKVTKSRLLEWTQGLKAA